MAPFTELISRCGGKKCLQIGARNKKYSPDFVCVDLYDTAPYVDFHYDVHQLSFEDGFFGLVVCNAVLEHVADPRRTIAELGRSLKEGGEIWIEVPFNQLYHPCLVISGEFPFLDWSPGWLVTEKSGRGYSGA